MEKSSVSLPKDGPVHSSLHCLNLLLQLKDLIIFLGQMVLKVNQEGGGYVGYGFLCTQQSIHNLSLFSKNISKDLFIPFLSF